MKERMFFRPLALLFCVSAIRTLGLSATQDDRAQRIYAESSKSVLYLIVRSHDGEILGKATGFVVAGGAIVTNEHVVRRGEVVIDTGTAKIPTTIDRVDAFNDLALLIPSAELAAKPLPIAETSPTPGASVLAIGNPAGLERTISSGIVSAVRVEEGRELLQITAPLSPGSSGGPILNTNGEVVGVAVGILTEGQNLNFAVPASLVWRLLKGEISPSVDVLSLVERVEELQYQRLQRSDWQEIDVQIDHLLESALERVGSDYDLLLKIAELAHMQNGDIAHSAAERAVRIRPAAEAYLALGKELKWKAFFAEDNADKSDLLGRSELALRNALRLSNNKLPTADTYYDLADVLEDLGKYVEADTYFRRALETSKIAGNVALQANSLRGLVRTSNNLQRPQEVNNWFKALVDTGRVTALDWQFQANRLDGLLQYEEAGQSYVQAALVGGSWMNWCEAASSFILVEADDRALLAARECVSEGSGKEKSEPYLAVAHREIASVLSRRGVYQEALSHAREATVLNPRDPFAFHAQTVALLGLRRFQEAINMGNQAIRLSDGKYSWMHFNLGSAYFEIENWEFARQSYEKAAELSPRDSAAAYNVALSLARLGYYRDAAKWFEEVLRRDPNHRDRQEILSRIQLLRR